MAHEASHVALGIFGYVGAKASEEESEPFAYLVGWAFKCMDTVRKWKEVVDNGSEGKSSDPQEVPAQEAGEEEKENRNG